MFSKKTDERLDKIEKQISLMNREIKSLLKEAKDNKKLLNDIKQKVR